MNTHHLNLLMTCVRTEETRRKRSLFFGGGGWAGREQGLLGAPNMPNIIFSEYA